MATNARTFVLQLEDINRNVYPMTLIGGDGGLLPEPEEIQQIRLMPAEVNFYLSYLSYQNNT